MSNRKNLISDIIITPHRQYVRYKRSFWSDIIPEGTTMTSEELREFIPQHIEKENIDEEIKDIIIEFNKQGYITTESCAGHDDDLKLGYIQFMDKLNRKDLRKVLKNLGFEILDVIYNSEGTCAYFRPYH